MIRVEYVTYNKRMSKKSFCQMNHSMLKIRFAKFEIISDKLV